MNTIIDLIHSTPEYREWGRNVISASFLATVVFTFGLQLPGLVSQARKIWTNRSAAGVEMLTFVSFFTYFIVFLVYAFSTRSGAGMVNALVLLPPQLVILAGVLRFSRIRSIDALAGATGLGLFVLAIVMPHKELFFSIASVAVFFGLLLQTREIAVARTSANVALSFPMGFAIVSLVWSIYGAVTANWYLSVAAGLFTMAYVSMVILCLKYRGPKHAYAATGQTP